MTNLEPVQHKEGLNLHLQIPPQHEQMGAGGIILNFKNSQTSSALASPEFWIYKHAPFPASPEAFSIFIPLFFYMIFKTTNAS